MGVVFLTAASTSNICKLRKDYRNGPTTFTTSCGNTNLGLRYVDSLFTITIMPFDAIKTMDQISRPIRLPSSGQPLRQEPSQSHDVSSETPARNSSNGNPLASVDLIESYPGHSKYERGWASG